MEFDDFLSKLSNPARRALECEGVKGFVKLAAFNRMELLKIHGIGPKSLQIIEHCLESIGLRLSD